MSAAPTAPDIGEPFDFLSEISPEARDDLLRIYDMIAEGRNADALETLYALLASGGSILHPTTALRLAELRRTA